jgi:hypothetical protein
MSLPSRSQPCGSVDEPVGLGFQRLARHQVTRACPQRTHRDRQPVLELNARPAERRADDAPDHVAHPGDAIGPRQAQHVAE